MRSAACVWLLSVTLLNMQGCAVNQFVPFHARGNTGLARRSSMFPHPAFQPHPVIHDNFPQDETDVTDEDMYGRYDYPGMLNGEPSIDNLIGRIREEMARSDGDPQHLAQLRLAIAKAREAIERGGTDSSLSAAARNEVGRVSEAQREEEVKELAAKIRQSLEKSDEQMKASQLGEQHNYDVREPSAAFGNHREDWESLPDYTQRGPDGVVVAPHIWEQEREINHQGLVTDQFEEYPEYPLMMNDENAQVEMMLHLMHNRAEWSGWSRCQGQCGTGYRTRTRGCRVRGRWPCEEQTAAEACPLKNECEDPRGYIAGTIVVSVLAALLVLMLAVLLLLPKIQKYRISRWESERDAFIQANLKKKGSMPDRPPPAAPRPASTLPKLPSGEHVYLTLSEVKVGGKTYLAPTGTSAEDCVYLTPSQINPPKSEGPENEEGTRDEENAYLELAGAN
ncbi:uncharacterized protein [Branchiostoma lanceolatum]|uniref:uncharacterized protein isoform X1 n=1 Tax=Branchiostoma lanceolatum TaxID=7740 RepID=UPI003455DBB6